MRATLTQLLGAGVVTYGLFLMWLPLGIVGLGAVLFVLGVALEGGK